MQVQLGLSLLPRDKTSLYWLLNRCHRSPQMKPYSILVMAVLALAVVANASAQNLYQRPLQKLVDCPTAGGPENRSLDVELRAYPEGGLLAGVSVGILSRITMGISHGGSGIIGFGAPDWNPQMGVLTSLRVFNESLTWPALAVGFASQGYGLWVGSLDRYQFKAKGIYAVASKNFAWELLGETGFHMGVNQNPMEGDRNKLDLFIATDFRPSELVAVIAEYSAALDDWRGDAVAGEGRGYLNAGIRVTLGERLAVDLNLRDLLNNQQNALRGGQQIGREIRISYEEAF